MKGFYGFWHRILAGPLRFLCNIRIEGSENEPRPEDGAFLVCANHTTAGDPVWLCASLRRQQPHFMSKAELFKIPLLGGLIRLLGAYPVERGSADVSSLRTTVNLLHDGKCVGMFPQGTRRPGVDPATTPVKSGVGIITVRGGVQILPVYIKTKKFRAGVFCRKNIIIGGIIRGRKTIIPGGEDQILPGDKVIVIAANRKLRDLSDILLEREGKRYS